MWGGRFERPAAQAAQRFTRSFPWDRRLFREDIVASLAHAEMLGAQGIIPAADAEALGRVLTDLLHELVAAGGPSDAGDEDIHSYVERVIIERAGDAGRRLHTARSRNDQVATDFRLYCKGLSLRLASGSLALSHEIVARASTEAETLLPGFTHLQSGQPITLGHYLLSIYEMLRRSVTDAIDTFSAADECPLGVGAVAGVGFSVDRESVSERLRFSRLGRNSVDAVADRDYVLKMLYTCSGVMLHLSRWCEDLVIWASPGYAMVEFDEAYATGSSLMPQKRNPDVAELVRGKAGTVMGLAVGVAASLKAVPLSYGMDLQEDKQAVLRAEADVLGALEVMHGVVHTLAFNRRRMAELATSGHALATEIADYLVEHEVPFRSAHEIAGQVVRAAIERDVELWELSDDEFVAIDARLKPDLRGWLEPSAAVARRSAVGGTAPARVREEIERAEQWVTLYEGRVRELEAQGLPEELVAAWRTDRSDV